MSRPETNDGRRAARSDDAEHEQVATLATKLAALPPHRSLNANRSSMWRSWLAFLFFSLAWLLTLTFGALAALRVFYHDGRHVLIWLNAFTRYVYLPAYPCLIVACWKRRWWLALANVAVIACHLWWIAPDFLKDRRFDSATSSTIAEKHHSPPVRIFFANVRASNIEHAAMLREIEAANPDVIVLVEFDWSWHVAFLRSPMVAAYPYGNGMKQQQVSSVNVFSKLPLKSETGEWVSGRFVSVNEISLGSETLRLVGLHAPRPMDHLNNDYDGYWNRVVPLLLAERGPTVIVGDCNATQYSLVYEKLKVGGLRSAHEVCGQGNAVSWPNGDVLLPPIRIDQAFLTPEVECVGISQGEGLGSDHKPFILDVQIRDRP